MLWAALALLAVWFLKPAIPAAARLDPEQLQAKVQGGGGVQLVDVRTPDEYRAGRVKGAKLIPLQELSGRYNEIDPAKPVVLVCRSGNRSGQAYQLLSKQGYAQVSHLEGGMLRWQAAGLPVER
jgi:rhodanese-related sulfurtransferase